MSYGVSAFRSVISHAVSHNQFDTYIICSGTVHERSKDVSVIVGQVFHFQFFHACIKITVHVSYVSVVIFKLAIDKVFLVWVIAVFDERNDFIIQWDNPVFSGIGLDTAYHVLSKWTFSVKISKSSVGRSPV